MQENNSTPTPDVATPFVVEQPKQSNFLIILLSILLVVSVAISGFFAYQTQMLVKELQEIREADTAESTAKPVATESSEVDPTVNWKTYTDKNGSFSFKYPQEWFLGNSPDGDSLLLDESYFDPNLIIEPDQVDITFSTTSNKELVDAYTANFISTSQVVTDTGITFKIMDKSLKSKEDGPASQYLFAQTTMSNRLYRFGLTSNNYKLVFDQILSTFKFLE